MHPSCWLWAFAVTLCFCTVHLTTVVGSVSQYMDVTIVEKHFQHRVLWASRNCRPLNFGFLSAHFYACGPETPSASAVVSSSTGNALLATGDAAVATPSLSKRSSVRSRWLLYEDDNLLILNKPAGITTEALASLVNGVEDPGTQSQRADFVNESERHGLGQNYVGRGLVHRLDAGTSGALVIAKTSEACLSLKEQFRLRQVKKLYVAITYKVIPSATTASWDIRRSRSRNGPMEASEFPPPVNVEQSLQRKTCMRAAVTLFKPILNNRQWGVVLAAPITGRTHQIRVHLKTLGTPVLGDILYGDAAANNQLLRLLRRHYKYEAPLEVLGTDGTGVTSVVHPWSEECTSSHGERYVSNSPPGENVEGNVRKLARSYLLRPLLHAARITIRHPSTCRKLSVTAPVPKDISFVLDYIDPSWHVAMTSVFANKHDATIKTALP